jgi:type IV secretion system protein VirB1
MDFASLVAECAPWVAPQTMAAIVKTESQFNPLAININAGAKLERQPSSKEEAVVSGVLINKERGATFTGSVITNAKAVSPTLWGAASENIYEDKNARLAANINGGYNLDSKQGAVGAGVFGDYKLGESSTLYGRAGVLVNNLGSTNDVAYTAGIGITFGAAPAPAKESSANALQQELASASVTSAASASIPAAKNLDYNFRDLSERDQQKVLTLMAETYQKIHPDVSTKEAKVNIMNQLAIAKYNVDAHGTKSFADDTPMPAVEHLAQR